MKKQRHNNVETMKKHRENIGGLTKKLCIRITPDQFAAYEAESIRLHLAISEIVRQRLDELNYQKQTNFNALAER